MALADAFGTRNASRIIDGLSELAKKQAERLEDAMQAESPEDPNPDITRQLNSLFSNGVKLAKLIDPNLAGGPKVSVNIGVGAGGNASIVSQQDPRQITANIVRELEASGIKREDITGEMIAGFLKNMGMGGDERSARVAIKAEVEQRAMPTDFDPEELLIMKPFIEGETV